MDFGMNLGSTKGVLLKDHTGYLNLPKILPFLKAASPGDYSRPVIEFHEFPGHGEVIIGPDDYSCLIEKEGYFEDALLVVKKNFASGALYLKSEIGYQRLCSVIMNLLTIFLLHQNVVLFHGRLFHLGNEPVLILDSSVETIVAYDLAQSMYLEAPDNFDFHRKIIQLDFCPYYLSEGIYTGFEKEFIFSKIMNLQFNLPNSLAGNLKNYLDLANLDGFLEKLTRVFCVVKVSDSNPIHIRALLENDFKEKS